MAQKIKVTTQCPMCGRKHDIVVDAEAYTNWRTGKGLIQECFPDMSAEEREMLITGTCPECWNDMFSDEDE